MIKLFPVYSASDGRVPMNDEAEPSEVRLRAPEPDLVLQSTLFVLHHLATQVMVDPRELVPFRSVRHSPVTHGLQQLPLSPSNTFVAVST
jgi:hypothetical protein